MTTLSDVHRVIADEGLAHFNLFDDHGLREREIGIRQDPGGLQVFTTDERAASLNERVFADETEAYTEFLKRLRANNREAARRRAERQVEREQRLGAREQGV
ncbi:hypothetical protein [Orlajensenia leifsoniae]|uniref:Uncharacterized protein n=1 Tax=Orlajensenia leifsoniae TaxID=2561933 RepID=A0A4Y9QVZ1_9MICO|nr:hypothetical protein [Leifsonia flava]TFV96639.1 hypothetical protein E4M00_11160 [Leifsonia flava]